MYENDLAYLAREGAESKFTRFTPENHFFFGSC
jgi:hypothetical protein